MRILTLNLQNYQDQVAAWPVRRERLLRLLGELNPDVVALQSVRYDTAVEIFDQVRQLQRLADYPHSAFFEGTQYSESCADGSGFLSRMELGPVAAAYLAPDPTGEDPTMRLVLQVRLDAPRLHLFNAHFSYSPWGFAVNLGQTLPFLNAFEGPRLLVGDFNSTPDAEPLNWLRRTGWEDLWPRFQDSTPGYTFQSFDPKIRIDYAWADRGASSWVRGIELAGAPGQSPFSDHFGLLITLEEQA